MLLNGLKEKKLKFKKRYKFTKKILCKTAVNFGEFKHDEIKRNPLTNR